MENAEEGELADDPSALALEEGGGINDNAVGREEVDPEGEGNAAAREEEDEEEEEEEGGCARLG